MASPIALSAALGSLITLTCPRCGQHQLVARRKQQHRACPRCKQILPMPPPGSEQR